MPGWAAEPSWPEFQLPERNQKSTFLCKITLVVRTDNLLTDKGESLNIFKRDLIDQIFISERWLVHPWRGFAGKTYYEPPTGSSQYQPPNIGLWASRSLSQLWSWKEEFINEKHLGSRRTQFVNWTEAAGSEWENNFFCLKLHGVEWKIQVTLRHVHCTIPTKCPRGNE